MSNLRTITVESRLGRKTVQTALNLREAVAVLRPQSNSRFVQDLICDYDQLSKRGRPLSNNRQSWLLVFAQETLDRSQQPENRCERLTDNFEALTTLLKRAKQNGTKFPRIRLQTETGRMVALSLAGDQSKTPGAVQVTDGGRKGNNTWFGRIATDGTWQPGRDASPDVVALLHAFAADPVRVATEYGRLTGQCCFCTSDLTDERSVLVGYGPICAEKFGLPWGERPAAPQAPVPVGDEEYDRAYAAQERAQEERAFLSDPDFQQDYKDHNHPGLALALRELVGAGALQEQGTLPPWVEED